MFGFAIPGIWFHTAAGSITVVLGIVYLLRAGAVVSEFKLVLLAHRRILRMALVSQGIVYCFTGALIIAVAAVPGGTAGKLVSWSCICMLLILSLWTGSTGARSENILFRASLLVTIIAAALALLGNAPGR